MLAKNCFIERQDSNVGNIVVPAFFSTFGTKLINFWRLILLEQSFPLWKWLRVRWWWEGVRCGSQRKGNYQNITPLGFLANSKKPNNDDAVTSKMFSVSFQNTEKENHNLSNGVAYFLLPISNRIFLPFKDFGTKDVVSNL